MILPQIISFFWRLHLSLIYSTTIKISQNCLIGNITQTSIRWLIFYLPISIWRIQWKSFISNRKAALLASCSNTAPSYFTISWANKSRFNLSLLRRSWIWEKQRAFASSIRLQLYYNNWRTVHEYFKNLVWIEIQKAISKSVQTRSEKFKEVQTKATTSHPFYHGK